MADDSIPIFSKVEAVLSNEWLKKDGSDVTDLLNKIEKAAGGNIEIRFRKGKYIFCGSLVHITAVHDLLLRKDKHPRLQLELFEESFASLSGPSSFFSLGNKCDAKYVHQESSIDESDLEFVTSQHYSRFDLYISQNENLVSNASVKSEAMQMSTSTESSSVETIDKSTISGDIDKKDASSDTDVNETNADRSDASAGGSDKTDESSHVETSDKDAGVSDTVADGVDKSDASSDMDVNKKSVDMSDTIAHGIDKQDKHDISKENSDQMNNAHSCSNIEENGKAALEVNKGEEGEIFSDERTVDPEIWDYMQEIKSDQLRQTLEPFGAAYKSKWEPADDVYKVRLVIQDRSMKENVQNSMRLVSEQFDRLYKDTFASCEVATITRSVVDNHSMKHILSKFPGILLKYSAENILLIGPGNDVHKAKKYLLLNSKKTGRMHKSFSGTMDLTRSGKMIEDRAFKSAIFTADDSVSSIEDDKNLKDNLEESLSKSPTEDEALVRAEKTSASASLDGCGDGATAADFEHLDSNNHREKSSSSESFSILQDSHDNSFDDAEMGSK